MRIALVVFMQNDGNFVDVILSYFPIRGEVNVDACCVVS